MIFFTTQKHIFLNFHSTWIHFYSRFDKIWCHVLAMLLPRSILLRITLEFAINRSLKACWISKRWVQSLNHSIRVRKRVIDSTNSCAFDRSHESILVDGIPHCGSFAPLFWIAISLGPPSRHGTAPRTRQYFPHTNAPLHQQMLRCS